MDGQLASTRLPPLNALHAFEVVGRLGSIRAAAEELFVTPGAVSRQVRVLESWLGVALFQRKGRSLQLTAAGARYLAAASEHLSAIGSATGVLMAGSRNESPLRVRAYALFAVHWLIPRLTGFHQSRPCVDLEIMSTNRFEDFGQFDVDAEIRGSDRPGWPGYEADLLVSDDVVLICSADYRRRIGLEKPGDLVHVPADGFLCSAASPQMWQTWLDSVGVTGVDASHGPSFGDSSLTLRAAAAGHGVGLAPRTFVESELAAGRLVVPFALDLNPRIDFYLVYPANSPRNQAFSAFRAWLLAGPPTADVAGAGRGHT